MTKRLADGLLNINEAAELIGKSTKTVRRYMKAGRFKGQRIGNALFFKKEDIESIVSRKDNKKEHKNKAAVIKEKKAQNKIKQIRTENNLPVKESKSLEDIDLLDKKNNNLKKGQFLQLDALDWIKDIIEENKSLITQVDDLKKKINNFISEGEKEKETRLEEIKNLRYIIESNKKGIDLLKYEIDNKEKEIKEKDEELMSLYQKLEQLQLVSGSSEIVMTQFRKGNFISKLFNIFKKQN